MKSIYITNIKLAPILEKLAMGEEKQRLGQEILDKLNIEKKECEDKCNSLNDEQNKCLKQKEEIQNNIEYNKLKLVRANKLLLQLKDEYIRWNDEIQ